MVFGWGSQRKQATKAAIDALRPIVGLVQHNCGLPRHFWTDPYVVGFFQLMVGHHAKRVTQGRIGGEELGGVLADVFTGLSNQNGAAIGRRVIELAQANNPDFNRGADDAAAICFYEMMVLKNEGSHPLVQTATRLAGTSKDRASILGMMLMASLVREIQEANSN
jgi:hypothetical protein